MIFIATYKRKLKDRSGNYVVPATRASCVYFDDNTTLSKLTFYPVGSIYQSVNETSPASLFGGDWERQYDRFLIGGGKLYEMGSEDGEAAVSLQTNQLATHTHKFYGTYGSAITVSGGTYVNVPTWNEQTRTTEWTGSGAPHNNMPPYRAIAMWIRTT